MTRFLKYKNNLPGFTNLGFDTKDVINPSQIITTSTSTTTTLGFSAEYQAILDYWVTTLGGSAPTHAISEYFDLMVSTMVENGVWAKTEFFDFFSTHTNTNNEALVNWKNPGTFNPDAVNAPTWTQYQGFTGANTGTKYISSNFIPSVNGTLIGKDNICAIIGVGSDIDESNFDFGSYDGTHALRLVSRRSGVARYSLNNWTANEATQANLNGKGYFMASRNNSANLDTYINLIKTNKVSASSALETREIYICGQNNNGSAIGCNRQLRFALLASYLTETEIINTINTIETCLDNLGTGLI